MLVINLAQFHGDPRDIKVDPKTVLHVKGDVNTAVKYIPPQQELDPVLADVARALRACFPDRAEDLMAELEVRLRPAIVPQRTRSVLEEAVTTISMSRYEELRAERDQLRDATISIQREIDRMRELDERNGLPRD